MGQSLQYVLCCRALSILRTASQSQNVKLLVNRDSQARYALQLHYYAWIFHPYIHTLIYLSAFLFIHSLIFHFIYVFFFGTRMEFSKLMSLMNGGSAFPITGLSNGTSLLTRNGSFGSSRGSTPSPTMGMVSISQSSWGLYQFLAHGHLQMWRGDC